MDEQSLPGDKSIVLAMPAPQEEDCHRAGVQRHVRAAVNTLGPRLRRLYQLHYVEEIPLVEVAELMNISTSSAIGMHRQLKDELRRRDGLAELAEAA